MMRILALEPYYGGSHQAFLDGWSGQSCHAWTLLSLPPHKWKWRMRHGAIALADEVARRVEAGERWDVVLCSDMLNLAEFRGLAPPAVRDLPSVVYFHENQLTYPVQHEDERDYHYVLTNLTTALAANRVWFNSSFHRDSFLDALPDFLKRMPDHQPLDAIERIRAKAEIHPPGIAPLPARGERHPGPMRILWAARWEHDKNPDAFFAALRQLKLRGVEFRINVIGEQFRDCPSVFKWARQYFFHHIDRWGYLPGRRDYEEALADADVAVSTADHEFFGLSMVEAAAAGAYPMLPRRLAYPEVLAASDSAETDAFFYDGSPDELTARLQELADRLATGSLWQGDSEAGVRLVRRYTWPERVPALDDALGRAASSN